MREAVSECLQHKRRPFHAIFTAWKTIHSPQGVAEIYQPEDSIVSQTPIVYLVDNPATVNSIPLLSDT